MDNGDYGCDALDQAIHLTVKEYRNPTNGRRGAVALAEVLGMPSSTLSNKANPREELTHLSVRESRSVMLASGDTRILQVLARDVGMAVTPLPTFDYAADMDLLDAWATWNEEVGRTASALKAALADHKVTQDEVAAVRASLVADFEKGLAMLDVLKGMAEPESVVGKVVKMGSGRG